MGCSCCKTSYFGRLRREKFNETLESIRYISTLALYGVDLDNYEKNRLTLCRLSDFKYKEKLGNGRFGVVYRVVERRSQRSLAMKETPKISPIHSMESKLEMEHIIMSKLSSPWLVEMFQCYEANRKLYMLLQFLPGPTLVQMVNKKPLDINTAKVYMAQMLCAVNAVHKHGYIHRDVKLANFILDHNGIVKMCDFGSCIRFLPAEVARKVFPVLGNDSAEEPPEDLQQACLTLIDQLQHRPKVPHGTSYYCAPEVIRLATWSQQAPDSGYSYLCDFWSLGVCFYYLVFGKLPFYSDYKIVVPSLILNWEKTLKFPRLTTKLQLDAADLICGMLQCEIHRLGSAGIHELTLHPFFADVIWSRLGIPHSNPLLETIDMKSHLADFKQVNSSSVWRTPMPTEQPWSMHYRLRHACSHSYSDIDNVSSYRSRVVSCDSIPIATESLGGCNNTLSQAVDFINEYNRQKK